MCVNIVTRKNFHLITADGYVRQIMYINPAEKTDLQDMCSTFEVRKEFSFKNPCKNIPPIYYKV